MAYDSLTPLPAPPNPDNPATFDTLAYPFTVAQREMVPELNAFIDALNEQGWPTVQVRAQVSGTAAAPVWTWEADPDTGIFLQGAGQWAVSAGGVRRLLISTTSISAYLPILSQPGTAAAPGLAFFGGSNAGLFLQSAGALGLSVGGTEQVRITEGGQVLAVGTGSPAIPSFSWIGDPNTGIYRPGNEQIAISTNGIQRLLVSTTAMTSSVPVFAPAGTAAAPGYSVAGDPNTGVYFPGADQVALTTGGVQRLLATTTALTSALPFYVPAGTAGNPAISPTGDTNTGMLFPAADTIAWSTGGTEKLRLTSAGLLTSSTAIVQNEADTVAGRLLTTGWMGLGDTISSTAKELTDWNDATSSGTYWSATSSAAANAPLGDNSRTWAATVISIATSNLIQIAVPTNQNRVAFRRRLGGTWAAWREIYNSDSILGTVSQSGGVPTGAIIERGSNANGEYVKFADGTMICTKRLQGLGPASTALGSGFVSANISIGSWPAAFSERPSVSVTPYGVDAHVMSGGLVTPPTATVGGTTLLSRWVSSAATTFEIIVTGIGRWF